jgi:ABC-type glycerol-3-phosphate transport system substrate-binding protein
MKKLIALGCCCFLMAAGMLFAGGRGEEKTAKEFVAPSEYGVALNNLNLDNSLHGQYKGKKITVIGAGNVHADALKEYAELFSRLSGAEVEVQSFGDDLFQKMELGIATGTADVIESPQAYVIGFQRQNLLANMDDLIRQYGAPGYDLNDFAPAYFNYACKDNGQLFAIPFKPDPMILFYRKDLLENPAIQAQFKQKTGKDLKVPETPEEMKLVADFFTRAKNPESPVPYGYAAIGVKGSSRWIFVNRLASYGGNMIDLKTGGPGFNNEAGRKALQFAVSLIENCPPEIFEIGYDELNLLFTTGDVFMAEQWPGLYLASKGSVVDGKVGFAVTPGQSPTLGGWTAAIGKNTRNPEVAWKFVEFMTSRDGEILKIKHTFDPCRISNFERDRIKDITEMYPVLMKGLSLGSGQADIPLPYVGAKLVDISELWIQRAYTRSISIDECLRGMNQDFRKEILDAGLQIK